MPLETETFGVRFKLKIIISALFINKSIIRFNNSSLLCLLTNNNQYNGLFNNSYTNIEYSIHGCWREIRITELKIFLSIINPQRIFIPLLLHRFRNRIAFIESLFLHSLTFTNFTAYLTVIGFFPFFLR